MDKLVELSPTLRRVAQGKEGLRCVRGPQGSAKTSGAARIFLDWALTQTPMEVAYGPSRKIHKVRYTKFMITRDTAANLRETTIPSIQKALGGIFKVRRMVPRAEGYINYKLPDGTIVDSTWLFLGLDSADSVDNLLGGEYTCAMVDEVSTIENGEIILALYGRCGRFPGKGGSIEPCVIMPTNGPIEDHFTVEWEEHPELFKDTARGRRGERHYRLYQQPPALIPPLGWPTDPSGEWRENPEAENVENLANGYDYYFDKLGGSTDSIRQYVLGQPVPLVRGDVVYPEFSRDLHVVKQSEALGNPALLKRYPRYFSFDFGKANACLEYVRVATGGVLIVAEHVHNGALETMMRETIMPSLRLSFDGPPLLGTGTGDPQGYNTGTEFDISPYGVIESFHIPMRLPGGSKNNQLGPRIQATTYALTSYDAARKPLIQITDNCKLLIDAMARTYVYPKSGNGDAPTKTHENFASDLANALEYLCKHEFVGHREEQRQRITRRLPSTKPKRRKKLI